MRISWRVGPTALFLLAFGAMPAWAQDAPAPRAERPFRGLFGGGIVDAGQLLTANASLGGGLDDDVLAGSRQSANPSVFRRRGSYGYGTAGLRYSLERDRAQLGASAGTSTRYYPQLRDAFIGSYNASVGGSVRALSHTRLSAGQSVGYQPYNILQLFPVLYGPGVGQIDVPDLDFVLSGEHYITYSTQAGLSQDLGRRVGFGLNYDYRNSHNSARVNHSTVQRAGGGFNVALGRGLGARVGYSYREGRYYTADDVRAVHSHSADAGLNFTRGLSLTRQTMFSFSTGSSAVANEDRQVYRVNGAAQLTHEIGRSWNAGLGYARNVRFIETFEEPFLYDSASAYVGGLLTRRLQLASSVRAAFGQLGLTKNSNRYTTYASTVALTFGVTRYIGLGTSYFYYRYSFGTGALLPSGIVRDADRQGVRAYVTAWAPLFHRPRRTDASR